MKRTSHDGERTNVIFVNSRNMTLRRNAVSLLIWVTIVIIFAIHVILSRKNDHETKIITGRSVGEEKQNFLIHDELESNNAGKSSKYAGRLNIETHKYFRYNDSSDHADDFTNIADYKRLQPAQSQSVSIEKFKNEILILNTKLQQAQKKLQRKEKQFKYLAKRLAAKLKFKDGQVIPKLDPLLPWVFAVTPTYVRYTQKAELVRLSHTLMHVVNFHWIIIEDSNYRTDLVSKLLSESGLSYTHLYIQTPSHMKRKRGDKYNKHHRGVVQRNLGIKWIRGNVNVNKTPGVVYFMDDDNTYDLKLFDEMRKIKHVGVWPVAFTGALRYAGPICSNSKVTGYHVKWGADRLFPIDMAGFAINLNVLINQSPKVLFESTAQRGYLEPTFLGRLTTKNQLEGLADNCTKVLVWHTRTESPRDSLKGEKEMFKLGKQSDPTIET